MLVKTYPLPPSLAKGRGRKREGDTGGEVRRSTKTEQNPNSELAGSPKIQNKEML